MALHVNQAFLLEVGAALFLETHLVHMIWIHVVANFDLMTATTKVHLVKLGAEVLVLLTFGRHTWCTSCRSCTFWKVKVDIVIKLPAIKAF